MSLVTIDLSTIVHVLCRGKVSRKLMRSDVENAAVEKLDKVFIRLSMNCVATELSVRGICLQ